MTTERTGTRGTAGFCISCDGKPITDAPENGNAGYNAVYAKRDGEGNVIMRTEQGATATVQKPVLPSHHRTLCRKHLKAELAERYPDGVDDEGNPLPDPFPNG